LIAGASGGFEKAGEGLSAHSRLFFCPILWAISHIQKSSFCFAMREVADFERIIRAFWTTYIAHHFCPTFHNLFCG
jgi:hypothetical protein